MHRSPTLFPALAVDRGAVGTISIGFLINTHGLLPI